MAQFNDEIVKYKDEVEGESVFCFPPISSCRQQRKALGLTGGPRALLIASASPSIASIQRSGVGQGLAGRQSAARDQVSY